MSALTYEIKNRTSPVARWLDATFPNYKEIQKDFRIGAGPARVLPSKQVSPGTQGAAIDFWLRMLIHPHPSIGLPLIGLLTRRVSCLRAGAGLLRELAGGQIPDGVETGEAELRIHPASFAGRGDEWWARVCYALALLVELYRAPTVEGSRLIRLGPSSGPDDLLGLANADEVADLCAMRALALERLVPSLPAGPVATGMTFDGSADLNADADLIAGGMLVDFKAGQGGSPRADGTRAASLGRTDLDQLLGYALMDYSDTYRLNAVAIYAVRFGHLAAWPLDRLCAQMAGRPVDFDALRREFAHLLRTQLPAQRERQRGFIGDARTAEYRVPLDDAWVHLVTVAEMNEGMEPAPVRYLVLEDGWLDGLPRWQVYRSREVNPAGVVSRRSVRGRLIWGGKVFSIPSTVTGRRVMISADV